MNATTWCLNLDRFRVRGDTVDVVPSYENEILRVELEGNINQENKRSQPVKRRREDQCSTDLHFTQHANTSCRKRSML